MEKHSLNIHVGQLADIQSPVHHILTSLEGKQYLRKEYEDLTFFITYPLEGDPVPVNIKKAHSLADILVPIAAAYKNEVYANPELHGIWGHDLDDLFFEGIIINENQTTGLLMGS